jgi:hypothetical protein
MIPVWLAGDPLVGILTTIGFFTFLIIGRAFKLRKMKQKEAIKREV